MNRDKLLPLALFVRMMYYYFHEMKTQLAPLRLKFDKRLNCKAR